MECCVLVISASLLSHHSTSSVLIYSRHMDSHYGMGSGTFRKALLFQR